MHWPQITWIVLVVSGWTIHLTKDGQPTQYSAGWSTIGLMLSVALLYAGGFFG